MSIEWDTLVLVPLVDDIFGEPITYAPQGALSFTVQGVFDHEYLALNPASGQEAASRMPVCGVREQAFLSLGQAKPKQGDTLIRQRNGLKYVVKMPQPDGHGHILLKLQRST